MSCSLTSLSRTNRCEKIEFRILVGGKAAAGKTAVVGLVFRSALAALIAENKDPPCLLEELPQDSTKPWLTQFKFSAVGPGLATPSELLISIEEISGLQNPPDAGEKLPGSLKILLAGRSADLILVYSQLHGTE